MPPTEEPSTVTTKSFSNLPLVRVFLISPSLIPPGQYLIQDNGKGMATGMNVNKESMWKINKSSVPYMPDWAILRPLISDNYLVQRHDGPQGNKTLQFGRDFRSLTGKNF